MGGEFRLVLCELDYQPDWATIEAGKSENQRILAEYHKRVDGLDSATLIEVADYVSGTEIDEENEYLLEETKADLHRYLDEYVGEDRSDTAWITLESKTYIVTGGIDYGSDPTEAWTPIAALALSGVTKPREEV